MEAVAQTHPSTPTENGSGGTPLSRIGLRGRLLGAILVVALTTLAVGVIGVQRMSVLSASAERVYTDGTVPLRELKQLQLDWWTKEAYSARSSITSAGPEVNAHDRAKATEAQQILDAQRKVVAAQPLAAGVAGKFAAFQKAADQYNQVQVTLQS